MREIKDIVGNINNKINLSYDCKFWDIASLQTKDGKTFPLVDTGNGKGEKLSINEKYDLQIYHRILDSETSTDFASGKGKYPYQFRTYSMRLVCTGKVKSLTGYNQDLNDKIKNEVYSALPVFLTKGEFLSTTNENVNKQEVLTEEFEGVEFNPLTLELVAFYIEYEIKQKIRCQIRQ